jgi:hypothetical protein
LTFIFSLLFELILIFMVWRSRAEVTEPIPEARFEDSTKSGDAGNGSK